MKLKIFLIFLIIATTFFLFQKSKSFNFNPNYEVGQAIDSLNHIIIYFNGGTGNVTERNTIDGYNLGLKYQCVEFVKRYYYEYYNHKMPDAYGHAVSFFDKNVKDGERNQQRNLTQFTNPSQTKPQIGDLIIFNKTVFNRFGHVVIIANVNKTEIEIIQQNPGAFGKSRVRFSLEQLENDVWKIGNKKILGWLRK
jgi:hypothetical protein